MKKNPQDKKRRSETWSPSTRAGDAENRLALRDTPAILEGFVNSTWDAIIVIDEDQRIVLFNKAAETMFRCPASEALHTTLDRFFPDYIRKNHKAHVTAFGKSAVTTRSMIAPVLELTCLRADGESFVSEVSISQVEASGKKLYTAIIRDITERKRAARELEDRTAALSRTNTLITALNKVAARAAKSTDMQSIMETLGEELKPLNLDMALALVEPGTRSLIVRYASITGGPALALAEKMTGLSLVGFQIERERWPGYSGVLEQGLPSFLSNSQDFVMGLIGDRLPKPLLRKALELVDIKSEIPFLILPLIFNERILGTLMIWGTSLQESDMPAALVFSAQIAAALENARLYQDALKAAERRTALQRSSQALVRVTPDLEQVYAAAHRAAAELMPAEIFTIVLVDESRRKLDGVYLFDNGGRQPSLRIPFGTGFSSTVIASGETILIGDYLKSPVQAVHFGTKDEVRSILAVPMRVGGQIFGAISAQSYQPNVYREDDRYLLEMLATQVAIAIQNGRLFEQARQEISDRTQAEEKLRASEARYRALFDQSHDAVFILDSQGNHITANRRAAEMLGYTVQEIQTLSVKDLSAELEQSQNILGRILSGEHIPTYSRLFRKRNGEVFPVEINVELVRDAQGKPLHIQSVVRDITERKRAEEALRQAEEKYRNIFENAVEAVTQTTPEGRYITANPAAARILGYDSVEELMSGVNDLNTQFYVEPGRREEFKKLMEEQGFVVGFESEVYRKDGSRVWVSENMHAVRDEQGILLYYEGTSEDITKRKKAEEAVKNSERRLSALIANGLDFISLLDAQGNLLWESPSSTNLLGYRFNKFLGRSILELAHPEDLGWVQRQFAEVAAASGSRQSGVFRMKRADGEYRWVEAVASNFLDDPAVGAIVINYRDITERKMAEEALRESETRYQKISEMISDYAYAFRVEADNQLVREWVTESFARITGYTSAETDERGGWPSLIHPEDMPIALARAKRLFAGQPDTSEFRIVHKDGEIRWLRDYGYPVWDDAQGRVVRIYGAVEDVTARKRHERQLEAQAMLARALGESLELQPLLERLLEAARHAIPAAEKGSVLLLEADGRLRVRALNGYTDPRLKEFAFASDLGYSARAARERCPLLIADARADDSICYDGEIEEARQIHGAIAVPLLIQERVIGVISLDSTQKDAFTQEDLNHLNSFAASAALVIENARLFEETRRRAEETTSLLEASLSLSKLDLQDTLQAIGERAQALFKADGCRIFLLEHDGKTLRCVLALAESEVAFADLRIELGQGVTGHVALTGEAEIVNDMLNDPRSQTVLGTEEEPEALMFAPLKSGQKTIGVISIRRVGSERPFHPADLDLLKAFASLAASAVSNARLFEEIQARLQELEILQTLSTSLRQARTVEEMLPLFIQYAAQSVNAAAGSIYLWEESSSEWVSRGWMTADGRWLTDTADLRHRPGEGVTGWVGERGENYVTTDWRADPTNQPLPLEMELLQRLTSGISLPLQAEEHIIGILHLWYAERREFSAEDKRLLTAIADMAGNAIQRARLFGALQASNTELEERVQKRTAELERANRAKDEFLANMSHELRTPLNSVIGLSESLLEQRRGALNPSQQNSLTIIESSARHLLDLINDVLDMSKIEAGMFDYYPQVVSVDDLCRSSLSFVKSLALKKSITIHYVDQAAVPRIYADPRRFKQVLVNLLNNAVKFTPDEGQVTLEVRADAGLDLIQFSVVDTGIGIAHEDLSRLFQPFTQVDSSLNRQYEGTGLGLALVQRLTEVHGGSVQVESEPGVGSRFTVSIPIGLHAVDPQTLKLKEPVKFDERTSATAEPVKPATILLAEDNMSNVLTVVEYLESHGHTLVVAHDGAEAVVQAGQILPDVILMDIQMPVMNGLEAIRKLRADPRFASTPIIALTALAMPGDRERCLEAGADEYMSKPVGLKILKQTIENLIHASK
jgi:PAS domain S-box-containing protein